MVGRSILPVGVWFAERIAESMTAKTRAVWSDWDAQTVE